MPPRSTDQRPLTVLVLDVSPVTWGEREFQRNASDKARAAKGKKSVGPATMKELLSAVQAFASAFVSLERDSALCIVGVAGTDVAIVYPRKDHLEQYFWNPENKLDTRQMHGDLMGGVTELVAQAAKKAGQESIPLAASFGAMASGFSVALCLINRFLVSTNAGVSALSDHHTWDRGNKDDEGVITAIGGVGGKKKPSRKARGWSPRVLLIQASDDRPGDYNALMNCAFAAVKHQIVVDGCFIQSLDGKRSSAFLEQTCDLTGGLFLTPSGTTQTNNLLTEVLLSVFLAPRTCRGKLNLPAINTVDFRARAFDTGAIVDTAFVCNQCLSIFENKPKGRCHTCDAEIRPGKQRTSTS